MSLKVPGRAGPDTNMDERRPYQPEQTQPLQGQAESNPIFSPGEHKGSDQSRLIPEIEKRIQRLSQPNEGEAVDVNLSARRVLQGLHTLEVGRAIHRYGPSEEVLEVADESRRSFFEITGQKPDNKIIHGQRPMSGTITGRNPAPEQIQHELNSEYFSGYLKALEDVLKFIGTAHTSRPE